MDKLRRICALSLCVMLVLSVIFSVAFISHGSSHCCVDEECQICATVHRCAELLEQLILMASFAAFFGVALRFVLCILSHFAAPSSAPTPVSLRVKLLN